MKNIIHVFLKTNYAPIDTIWTYNIPENLIDEVEPGKRLIVPFGRGDTPTLAMALSYGEDFDNSFEVKDVIDVVDEEPILTQDLIDLGIFMSERYLVGISRAFLPILPPGNLKEINHKIEVVDEDVLSNELKDFLAQENYVVKLADAGNFGPEIKSFLKRGALKSKIVLQTKIDFKYEKYLRLYPDIKDIESLKLRGKQKDVVEYLKSGECSRKKLMTDLDISSSPINTLNKKGIVEIFDKQVMRTPVKKFKEAKKLPLNMEQIEAIKGIEGSNHTVNLLKGVTGSGKTEVYLRITENIVKDGGQVIVLVPEISLTPQMIERFNSRFKDKVSIMHSKLSKGERFDEWSRIKSGEVSVVVGVRSGVFAPFENLKMIIIDEEHDPGYRNHSSLRYDTYDVAKKRCEIVGAKLLIGSATPSVERYYEALNGEIGLFELRHRAFKAAKLPHVTVVNMAEELFAGNMSIFSRQLHREIEKVLEEKTQAILFLNRRGYSNFVSCRECGYVVKCDSCDISMNYHKNIDRLRCHYCGKTKPLPKVCPQCGSKYIKRFGVGTQQVEEEVKKLFPKARVMRVDRDTMGSKRSYEKTFDIFKSGGADILVGTQMISKGHDFPNVTLVGVIAADLSLYISDYRAHETTFQLLTQVSGRAGRGAKEGSVVIQTYSPEEYSITSAETANYEEFYNREIEMRREYFYPPFYDIFTLSFASKEMEGLEDEALEILKSIGEEIKGFKTSYTKIIDMPKIKDIYRVKFQLRCATKHGEMLRTILKRVVINNREGLSSKGIFLDIEFN